MILAENRDGSRRILERAGKPVPLGRDVFRTGSISRESLSLSLQILGGFRELLAGYDVRSEDVSVIATSALREASNRDAFVDRVSIKAGFRIDIVEGIEENRLTYIAVQDALQSMQSVFSRSNALIIEVGGGSTELMVLKRGKVVAAHSVNVGTVRIEQQLASTGSMDHKVRFLRENIRNVREVLGNEFNLARIKHFVSVGGDARLAAERVGVSKDPKFSIIEKEKFDEFVRSIDSISVDECVAQLHIPYDQADGLATGLLMYQLFMEGTNAEQLIVPQVSIRDGMLLSLVAGPDKSLQQQFDSQVLASADSIGRKYQFDTDHARHVANLSLQLYDQLELEHGLTEHDRLLLHVAALLHDIGTFIKASAHHKHGQYIVSHSEIFGLHRDDTAIVGNIVRYHRNTVPKSSHTLYMSLSREDRIKVLKLSGIVRVADALDRAHVQRIQTLDIVRREDTLEIGCDYAGDISIERYGLVSKGTLFEEVFGMKILIRQLNAGSSLNGKN